MRSRKLKLFTALLAGIMMVSNFSICTQAADGMIVMGAIEAINDEKINDYIGLFNPENQEWMNNHVNNNGSDEFFQEDTVELLKIKKLSYTTGLLAASVTEDELERYEDIEVYYTKENVISKSWANDVESGTVYKVYVIENVNYSERIVRISSPNQKVIFDANESFEGEEYSQIESRALLQQPATISVYFTKEANKTYYGGSDRRNIDFTTYIKNVVPVEWTVSWYGRYPEYLRAGTLASKMFAWHQVLVHYRGYAPYYTDVLDNSNDQKFLATSYADLASEGSQYQQYVDSALSSVSNIAILKGAASTESNIFKVEYRTNTGTQYSGIMNQEEALQMAEDGVSYQDILRYYYDYCPEADGNQIYFGYHG